MIQLFCLHSSSIVYKGTEEASFFSSCKTTIQSLSKFKATMQEVNPRTLVFAVLLTMLICSCSVHSCDFATSSPSPSPAIGIPVPNEPSMRHIRKGRRGSLPAICHSKCNQCEPCRLVQVSVRAMALEENEYYPQVWRCACGDNIFFP